jgi:Zn-dependent peptidase ImmA (M78 family)
MPSVVAELRALCPARSLAPWEASGIAERQAARLLRWAGVTEAPVPEQVIEHLPRIDVRYRPAAALHGVTRWDGHRWRIVINRRDTWGRQRFSLAHEYKHILDAPVCELLYRDGRRSAGYHAERAADAFAAALLMPRVLIKRAFYDRGIRDEHTLARAFQVSVAAMRVRLDELRLFEPRAVLA